MIWRKGRDFLEQNYKLTIAYDGTRFFGWERQPGKDTIQGKLEAVLGQLQGRPVNVIGAGRTDAGVHARAMTANVVLDVAEKTEDVCDKFAPMSQVVGTRVAQLFAQAGDVQMVSK